MLILNLIFKIMTQNNIMLYRMFIGYILYSSVGIL